MARSLKILVVEDRPDDVEMLMRQLRVAGLVFESRVVDDEAGFRAGLADSPDIILSDFEMPRFNGLHALEILRASGLRIPFIIISGSIGEDVAVDAMRQGADDYLLKDRMARLGSAIEQALEKHRLQHVSEQAAESLRASEERFRQIAENIHEVFWMTDPVKGVPLYVSPAYESIWCRPCASYMSNNADWLEAVHADDRPRVAAASARQLEADYNEVYRVVRPDGSIRWVRDRAYPIRDAQGRVYRIVGTAEDITEHRKLEEQFLQAQKMEAIGTLAGGIAHDFNNILAAITGYLELLQLQIRGQPEATVYLDALMKASARATSLVRQILAFSRQGEHERKPLDLSRAVAEPLQLLRATIPATIAFEVNLPAGLPRVLADETHVHQLVMNLGTNAAHAMKERPGTLTVRTELTEVTEEFARTTARLRAGPYVVLTVGDTGKGMTPELMERMFEPFFTTKAPGEGTGLGLAVVHGVMQTHEGEVTVKSAPGQGTTFRLYFPVYAAPEAKPVAETEGELPRGRGERVLFVDDEAPIMFVGRLILEGLGYQVEGGTEAAAALKKVKENPGAFDLVITDLTMPGMTGVEFARSLLAIRPGLPIILTTGYNAALTPDRVQQLGIRDLIMKPLSMHSLAVACRRALDERAPHGS